ncbi:hypothetical protein Apa02nite_070330 [Actinoplanes palleronii]|uniref:Uncharacterized protein n=1 Tax=Actinoplanes palleronii TaxID=113570 RepID=A0ABQ4BJR8_9ACTN|nr:hypothetical protein Apa02nite_070330 [Actinoplanes palleronii]
MVLTVGALTADVIEAFLSSFPGGDLPQAGTELAPAARGLVIETYAVVAGASQGRSLCPSG